MSKNPLVSIVIPVYKGANYLAEAIDSALAQTYKNIEIVVVNDGSPDDGATERVALSYGDKIRYIYQKNGGVSSALNTGIKEMRGEYFSWLSHDDLYEPTKIEKQDSLIQSDKDIILCSGSLIDGNGKPVIHHTKTVSGRLNGVKLFRLVLHDYCLNGLGFLVPKYIFEKEGGFDESLRYMQDMDMWLRIMWKNYTFVCQKDLLVKSRIHAGQQTNTIAELYVPDSKSMLYKHIEYFAHGEMADKIGFLKCYLLFVTRGGHEDCIRQVKKLLKENGCKNTMPITCFVYSLKGILKRTLRKVRDFLYILKGQRTK